MDTLYSIFPAYRQWPLATDDVAKVPLDTAEIRLLSGARNVKELHSYSSLRALWCFDISAREFESICQCTSLESLYIENVKTVDLSSLKYLSRLRILGLESCSKVTSFVDFGKLHSLSGLALCHFKNVHDLAPLSDLNALRALAVAGSMWTRMRVASFEPLRTLKRLELLHLTNIKALDESLRPLSELTNLRILDIANFYPMSEFARLAQSLKSTKCTWFEPYVELENFRCKKCDQSAMLMLSGSRKSMLCARCDGEKVEKHAREWNEAADAAS